MIEILNILLQIFIFLIIFSFPFTDRSLNNTLKLKNIKLELIDSHVINIIIFSYLCLIVSFLDIDLKLFFKIYFSITLLFVLLYINWAASIITAIFMLIMFFLITWKRDVSMTQETQSNIEIFLNGLMTIVIMSVGAMMIIAGTLDVGLLIGSNILAARALQGTSKYAKATEFLKQRDQAVAEIINYVKSK